MCTTQGFPLVGLPGANVFFTDHDASTPDGFISCKEITARKAAVDLWRAGKYLARLIEGL